MSAKHTPGPWAANFMKLNGETYHWHVVDAKHGTMNAVAMSDEESGTPRTAEELRANALLIAAAPELLAHLKFAVALLGAMPLISGTAQVEAMRAAIAKATGEEA